MKYKDGQTVWYAGRWRFIIESFSYAHYLQQEHKRGRCTLDLSDAGYHLYLLGLCSNPLNQKLGFESWIDMQQKKRPHCPKKRRASTNR